MQVTNYMNSDNDFSTVTHNGLHAGDRNPVSCLRQGYGACTLLWAG